MVDLFVAAWAQRNFDQKCDRPVSDSLIRYYEKFLRPFNLKVDTESLQAGLRNDFLSMCCALGQDLSSKSRIDDADLLLLAHDTPNSFFPSRCIVASLMSTLGIRGQGTGYAVTEQGAAAPFIAISLVRKYAALGRGNKAIIFVTDQSTLAYQGWAISKRAPTTDYGIAFLLTTVRSSPLRLHQVQSLYVGHDECTIKQLVTAQLTHGNKQTAISHLIVNRPLKKMLDPDSVERCGESQRS